MEVKKKKGHVVGGNKKRSRSISMHMPLGPIGRERTGVHRTRGIKDYTADRTQLVVWTYRARIIANSLAGSTQLLLLAHTPVSRKVFQYFHCLQIAGRSLMHADYNISCTSVDYFAFLPVVLAVLVLGGAGAGFVVVVLTSQSSFAHFASRHPSV